MNRIAKSVAVAMALAALPFAAQAADSSAKDWPTFKKADADSSGAVSVDEARSVTGLSENFASYDKNGDGQLSRSEYESAKKAQKGGKAGETSNSSGSSGSSSTGSTGSSTDTSGASGSGSTTTTQ
ncbi:MAG: hypothetical protein HY308_02240 [Gammaproteobacteria bacterium]|nr:hypothetical protein [Gammaproteobacteria bacterium]